MKRVKAVKLDASGRVYRHVLLWIASLATKGGAVDSDSACADCRELDTRTVAPRAEPGAFLRDGGSRTPNPPGGTRNAQAHSPDRRAHRGGSRGCPAGPALANNHVDGTASAAKTAKKALKVANTAQDTANKALLASAVGNYLGYAQISGGPTLLKGQNITQSNVTSPTPATSASTTCRSRRTWPTPR